VVFLSEEVITLSSWTLSDVEKALLERMRKMLSQPERFSPLEAEEEKPCWWILSTLDRLDGKEAREAYYAKL
jgi:hypothetical protein